MRFSLSSLLPVAALAQAQLDAQVPIGAGSSMVNQMPSLGLQVPIGSSLLDQMPLLGFGTWNLENSNNASAAVSHALQTGYRHIDAAAIYGNEKFVGKGIKDGLSLSLIHI